MPDRDGAKDSRNALITAGVAVIGIALVIEMQFIMPHDPVVALYMVLGAALVATAITLRHSRR